jgi:hypothetical protein
MNAEQHEWYWKGYNDAKKQQEFVGLTDEDRQAAFESMPDMLEGFLKTWGWLHFSKAIEAKLKEKRHMIKFIELINLF